MEDVQQRMKHDRRFSNEPRQVKAGENVHMSEDGRLQCERADGQVMMVTTHLIANGHFSTQHETASIMLRRAFPLDWMYPYCVSAGD